MKKTLTHQYSQQDYQTNNYNDLLSEEEEKETSNIDTATSNDKSHLTPSLSNQNNNFHQKLNLDVEAESNSNQADYFYLIYPTQQKDARELNSEMVQLKKGTKLRLV